MHKITSFRQKVKWVLAAFVVLLPSLVAAQDLVVLTKPKQYRKEVARNAAFRMTELHTVIPDAVYDLRYATTENFTGQQLYGQDRITFLRAPVAAALAKAAAVFREKGYCLKIWDAYRPYAATQQMWTLLHDERYVANPAKGSGHNRGLAVDLTLIDNRTGREVSMGTGFDNFTDSAHHAFRDWSLEITANRRLLRTVMESVGFSALETEWWHYSWPNREGFSVLNLPFAKFKN